MNSKFSMMKRAAVATVLAVGISGAFAANAIAQTQAPRYQAPSFAEQNAEWTRLSVGMPHESPPVDRSSAGFWYRSTGSLASMSRKTSATAGGSFSSFSKGGGIAQHPPFVRVRRVVDERVDESFIPGHARVSPLPGVEHQDLDSVDMSIQVRLDRVGAGHRELEGVLDFGDDLVAHPVASAIGQ